MDPKLLLLKHFEKIVLGLFVAFLLYIVSGLLGSPAALEKATGVGETMTKVQNYVDTQASLEEAKGPGWKAELERKLDPGAIPTASKWAPWLSHRRPGIVYYVEVIDKTFTAEHGGAIDVTGDTSMQGKIQLNWGVSPDTKYVQCSYEVHRTVDGKDEWKKVGETEDLSFIDSDISTRLAYQYKVVSVAVLDKTDGIFSDPENQVTLRDEDRRVESNVVGPFATQRTVQVIPVSTKPMTEEIEIRDPDFKESCNVIVRVQVDGKWEEKSFYRIGIGDKIGAKKGKIDFSTGATLADVLLDEPSDVGVKPIKVIKIEWPDGQQEVVKSDDPKLGTE